MRIRLEGERRENVVQAVRDFFRQSFDEELSDYRARKLVDFFVKALGAPVYNQAIRDARGFMLEKLEDLEGEFYEPE
jgi:uncharacterized protein (DUF2164 family)